jgi:DNA-binding MarR family transcriptional regulator
MVPILQDPKADRELDAEACARQILETVPLVMRAIRKEMREATEEQLSVPQFRVLAFLGRHRGASLSTVADHLGVTDATASAMVDRLVKRGLVGRETHPLERRRIELRLTRTGSTLLERARGKARTFLTQTLASASPGDLKALVQGLELLRRTLETAVPGEDQP